MEARPILYGVGELDLGQYGFSWHTELFGSESSQCLQLFVGLGTVHVRACPERVELTAQRAREREKLYHLLRSNKEGSFSDV